MAIFAILGGIYWKEDLTTQPMARVWILALMSQLEFLLAMFVTTLWSSLLSFGDYMSSLEKKVNHLAKETLVFWESEVFRTLIWHPRTPSFWSAVGFHAFCLHVFLGFFCLS